MIGLKASTRYDAIIDYHPNPIEASIKPNLIVVRITSLLPFAETTFGSLKASTTSKPKGAIIELNPDPH